MSEARAIDCEHNKEMPAICPCAYDCYCWSHSCKGRDKPSRKYIHVQNPDAGFAIEDLDYKAAMREKQKEQISTSKPSLQQIFEYLAGSWTHQGIIEWFNRPRHLLNGRTPAQAIDDGDMKLVLELAKESAR
jgi:hypothetical protein